MTQKISPTYEEAYKLLRGSVIQNIEPFAEKDGFFIHTTDAENNHNILAIAGEIAGLESTPDAELRESIQLLIEDTNNNLKQINLDKWTPTDEDTAYAIEDIQAGIESFVEIEEFEWAEEYKQLISKIKSSSNPKALIQGYLLERYLEAVDGYYWHHLGEEYQSFVYKCLGIS